MELNSSSATPALEAAVIGYGSFGRVHASKYHRTAGARLGSVVDSDPERRRKAREEIPGIATFATLDELLEQRAPQLASVVVPAAAHYATARRLLAAGIHVLVEKPLASELQQARKLVDLAAARRCVLQPGHLERFNHTLAELHARLPSWNYLEARRMTRWSSRATDVDVVMDLMIHDIDMLLELTDAPLVDIQASGVKVFSDHWDVASARLTFGDGSSASLTASRASLEPERRLHVFAESACALANIDDGLMLLHRRQGDGLATERSFCRHEDALAAEINAFVQSVRLGRATPVTAEDGYRAVEIADRIGRAIQQDEKLLNRLARPMANSEQAIAYLQNAFAQ